MKRQTVTALAAAIFIAGGVIATGGAPAWAQDRVEHVQFARHASSKAVNGRITGDKGVVYVVSASAGQTLAVNLKAHNGSVNFNVTAPGANEAMFMGATSGNSFKGPLPATGEYRIQVYLMRNAARRNEAARFTLNIAVTGMATAGAAAAPGPRDATVAGTPYQATAMVGCATAVGAPLGKCKAGVMRRAGGESTVEITLPDGSQRHIYFTGTTATASDSRVSGFSVRKNGDLNIISVGGKERYEFPDAFVTGG